ncbi:nuclear transport factor 2 family protein [Aquimarina algiphila]|uniref:nuclear transport factor 2 family protein n=1 Tax=Aquimarina algiphila TaxID=2047982 RepID=UPI00248FE0E9|nr:nuclear transport factor 2 family protein [Aquimarina algiphila]
MRNTIVLLTIFITSSLFSQTDTEIYLFDIIKKGETITLDNKRNISNNEGYDNQPSFFDDTVLFSSTRKKQTDIAAYHIKTEKINWITSTQEGSEYSPTKIPNKDEISSIRLDRDGKQLLYRYNYKTGESKALLEGPKVGYHTWYTPDIIVSSVLEDNAMSLIVSNLNDGSNHTLQKKVGRSLHKIPNSKLISYISKENKIWKIKSIHPMTGITQEIINTIPGAEDMCWLPDGTILMGKGNTIFQLNPKTDTRWSAFHSFTDKEIGNITRIATNITGNLLTVVSDISPEHIVQKQVNAYNARDIDAFLSTYSDNISIYNYPNTIRFTGKEEMRTYYEEKFKKEPNLHCKIKHRIVLGNKVIDEEYVTYKDRNVSVAAIYEVENGKIIKVTFIRPLSETNEKKNPEKIIQKQLDAYNARDISAFIATYSKTIKVYNFPNKLLYEGQEKMKKNYTGFFEQTPDLNCKIKNRIIMGNTIIDEEFLTIKSKNYSAVAIYEVENTKIAKVTFIQ